MARRSRLAFKKGSRAALTLPLLFLEELLTASRLTPTTVLIGQPQQADLQFGDFVEVVLFGCEVEKGHGGVPVRRP